MPYYEYECEHCCEIDEKYSSIEERDNQVCEVCGRTMRRLVAPIPTHFHGTGFHVTDYKS